jgi:PAS domain S-box-containing protein
MTTGDEPKGSDLRTRAETMLGKSADVREEADLSPEKMRLLIHELQVHQIELEMQNEELRQSQVKLEELKDKYLDLYDFSPVGYLTLNDKGLVLEANLTAVRLLGAERKSLTKMFFSHFVSQEFGDAFYLFHRQVFETQCRQTCEIELSREDGSIFHAQLESIAVQDESGQFNKSRTILSDITDRKKIEDAHLFLLQSNCNSDEDFFASLARYLGESLGMFYVCVDRLLGDALNAKTVAVYCDGKFEDNVEYALKDTPCGDVVGKTICCFPRDVRHLFPQDIALRELMAESYVGTTLWNAQGQPIGLIAVIGRQPLSDSRVAESILKLVGIRAAGELERRIAEEKLRDSEEKFRQLAENIQEVFWLTEPGKPKRVDYLSPSHEQIYGVSREYSYENPGTWLKSIHPEDRENVIRVYEEFLRGERDYAVEYRIVRPDGFPRWIWDRAFPVRDEQGNLVRVAGLGQDITDRKHLEEGLRKSRAQLENQVRDRTEELVVANKDLEFRAKDLVCSNKDLEHFAYVASHDLQEPLRTVTGALQLLEKRHKGKLGKDSDQLIHFAVDGAKKMKTLIEDLLTYSRLSARAQRFEIVDMKAVINRSIINLKSLIEQKGTKITFDEMPPVKADPTLMLQVFQNLIGNAVKFGPAESPKVHVSAQKNTNEWIFSVKDNGIGIQAEFFDRIFVIFQQLDKTESFHGTGMGLAIVKNIVERCRGRIWVESEVGEGSTFYFTIPER